ncbi:hypothetical protein LTR05_008052 [Lithohypha guttulata]|uniref:Uncharacterized protein n=1 Tax=Lithohypha guttulata TaxID=1690604 RepID=A0AAN7Y3U7_9EURO|nr:hypothetical protein LTR05_008052 [Lithohypha guttulata]
MSDEKYDEDARVLDSVSDLESDGETLIQSLESEDKDTLEEYDEAERLLTEEGALSKQKKWKDQKTRKETRRGRRREQRRRSRSGAQADESNSVYEMEEGYKDSSSNSSTDSLVLKQKAGLTKVKEALASSMSNGTHLFVPTTIVISLDGFRADFLQRGLTPSLNAFIASGVSPQYMLPSFPSVTFPNHYTLVTGLYPESHGVVGNQFWDPHFEEEFVYTNTSISMQPKWWESAEPLWETAERQGMKTAIHMWPGSEAHIHGIDPTYLDPFDFDETLPNKVARILEWLDLDTKDRPQLIAAYVPDVDRDGHRYGPNSTEIRATIASADNMLTLLVEGLLQRNLTEIVNLVVVSDHGMATMSAHRMVQLDDLIDMNLVDHLDGWPLRGLRLKNPDRDVPVLYKQLSDAAKKHGTFDVYTRDTMPERYHFSQNPRIAPLWIVPKTGWLVIEKEDFDIADAIATDQIFHPIGIHGFDHEHPLMRAIFVARGPAFPHSPNSRVPVFQNVEVYNILCDSLGVTPHGNNGTLRLPLQTEGLHSDFIDTSNVPNDNPADIKHADAEIEAGTDATSLTDPTATVDNDLPADEEDNVAEEDAKKNWWKYLHDQIEKAKDWAKQVMDSIKDNKANDNDPKPG